jgi:hypothetical protein
MPFCPSNPAPDCESVIHSHYLNAAASFHPPSTYSITWIKQAIIEPMVRKFYASKHTLLSLCSKNWISTLRRYSRSIAALLGSPPLEALEIDCRGVSDVEEDCPMEAILESRGIGDEGVCFSATLNRFNSSDKCCS